MAKDKRKRDAENKLARITKTCEVFLDGDGQRFSLGEFTLTEVDPGPKLEEFADSAFKATRASLVKLRIPMYRLVVINGQREEAYGLSRWVKLIDGSKEEERFKKPKQTVRKTEKV